jgi:hypothetical protein
MDDFLFLAASFQERRNMLLSDRVDVMLNYFDCYATPRKPCEPPRKSATTMTLQSTSDMTNYEP